MAHTLLYHPAAMWQHDAPKSSPVSLQRLATTLSPPDLPILGPRVPPTRIDALRQLHHFLLFASVYDLLTPSLYTSPLAPVLATMRPPEYPHQATYDPRYWHEQAKRFFNALPVALQPQLRLLLAKAAQHPLTPSQSAFLALLSDPIQSRRITLPSTPLSAPGHPSAQLRWLRPLLSLTITRYARAHSLYLPVPGTRTRFAKTREPQTAQCPRCQSNLLLIPAGYAQPAKPLEALCSCGVEDMALELWLGG